MKSTAKLLWILMLVFSLALLSGGCGGSSGDDTAWEESTDDGDPNDGAEAEEPSGAFSIDGPFFETLSDGTVLIYGAGSYTLSGELDGNGVLVEAAGQNVILYLNGVSIANADGPAICFSDGATGTVHIVAGTHNYLADGGSDEDHDAALFSSIPLTIEGEGMLDVLGIYQEGIASDSTLTVNGGTIYVVAADDGLNSGGDMTVNGGSLYVQAVGDGLDSNANLSITGGTVISIGGMEGGDGGLDIDQGFTFSLIGGTVIATGNTVVTPNGGNTQTSLLLNYQGTHTANTLVRIEGDSASLTFAPALAYGAFFYSSPVLVAGTYRIYSGGSVDGTATDGLYDGTYTAGTMQTHFGDADGNFAVAAGTANTFSNVGADQTSGGAQNPGGTPPNQPGTRATATE